MTPKRWLLALALAGCARPTTTSRVAEVIDVAVIAQADSSASSTDASRARGVFAMQSSTCTQLTELSNALDRARAVGATSLSCAADASVVFTIPLDEAGHPLPRPFARVLRLVWRDMAGPDRREVLAFLERGARRGEVLSLGEFERDRATHDGRAGVVAGRIVAARTEGEETLFTIAVGREGSMLTARFPSLAERWMVPGARVRAYGLWGLQERDTVLLAAVLLAQ